MPLWFRCTESRNSSSNRATSSTGTSSRNPDVPAQTTTTCRSTGSGLYCGCLSSSTTGALPPGHLLDLPGVGDGELAQAERGGAVAGDAGPAPAAAGDRPGGGVARVGADGALDRDYVLPDAGCQPAPEQ